MNVGSAFDKEKTRICVETALSDASQAIQKSTLFKTQL